MPSLDDELARARLLKRLGELADELGIVGGVRSEMLAEPARAVPVLEHAKGAVGVRNPAAFAISLWRRQDRDVALPDGLTVRFQREPEPDEPPALDALEQAWALDHSALRTGMLKLLAAGLARHGGLGPLRERTSFD